MHFDDWQVHLASLIHLQSCSTQDNDSSIKFSESYQMAASTAPPSSLFSTCCIFPTRGKCAAGSSQLDASAPCVPVHLRAQIWPQISIQSGRAQHSALCSSSFPFLPNHRFRLFSHTLHYCADHTRRVDSFVRLVWNGSTVQTNLQLPICRFPNSLRSIF